MVSYTLSTEAIDALEELADIRGMSLSGMIEHCIREESFRQQVIVGRRRR